MKNRQCRSCALNQTQQAVGSSLRLVLATFTKVFTFVMLVCSCSLFADIIPVADGFQGIWQGSSRGTYLGAGATGPQQHTTMAMYRPESNKTYFVYGAHDAGRGRSAVSYFDHTSGMLARPRYLDDRGGVDYHNTPTLSMDSDGYLFVFGNAHGGQQQSIISRSDSPYDIAGFERVVELPGNSRQLSNFSYAQPHYTDEFGHVLLHTHYDILDGSPTAHRNLYVAHSEDGIDWGDWTQRQSLSKIEFGQYQVSDEHEGRISTAFNTHFYNEELNIRERSNLYFMSSSDGGLTWETADGERIVDTLTQTNNPALIHDYRAEGKLVYLKNVTHDSTGNPAILYLTSDSFFPGEGAHEVFLARWNGSEWIISKVTDADHNYDYGAVSVTANEDGTERWTVIGAFLDGPTNSAAGGEIARWVSADAGATWNLDQQITRNSEFNHTFPKLVENSHDQFNTFWSAGSATEQSEVSLYFSDREGNVYRMPTTFEGDFVQPVLFSLAVPEPSSFALLSLGTIALIGYRIRKRQQAA